MEEHDKEHKNTWRIYARRPRKGPTFPLTVCENPAQRAIQCTVEARARVDRGIGRSAAMASQKELVCIILAKERRTATI